MSDRTLKQLIFEAQLLKTKETRQAWADGLSPNEVEVFTTYVNKLIDQMTAIFKRISEAILEGGQ